MSRCGKSTLFNIFWGKKNGSAIMFLSLSVGFGLLVMMLFDCSPYVTLSTGCFVLALWTAKNGVKERIWESPYPFGATFFGQVSSHVNSTISKTSAALRDIVLRTGWKVMEFRLTKVEEALKTREENTLDDKRALVELQERFDRLEEKSDAKTMVLQRELWKEKEEKRDQVFKLWTKVLQVQREVQETAERLTTHQASFQKKVDDIYNNIEVNEQKTGNDLKILKSYASKYEGKLKKVHGEIESTKRMVINTEKSWALMTQPFQVELSRIQLSEKDIISRLDAVQAL